MANSALKEPSGYQARTTAELPSPVRVILPTTAEAAQPPQPPQQTSQQAASGGPGARAGAGGAAGKTR